MLTLLFASLYDTVALLFVLCHPEDKSSFIFILNVIVFPSSVISPTLNDTLLPSTVTVELALPSMNVNPSAISSDTIALVPAGTSLIVVIKLLNVDELAYYLEMLETIRHDKTPYNDLDENLCIEHIKIIATQKEIERLDEKIKKATPEKKAIYLKEEFELKKKLMSMKRLKTKKS